MIFTTKGLYFKDVLTSPVYCAYTDLSEFSIPDDAFFSSKGLKDMLQDLFIFASDKFIEGMTLGAVKG